MSYEFELDAWRDAVAHSSEADLEAAQDSHRAALGIIGDEDDAR